MVVTVTVSPGGTKPFAGAERDVTGGLNSKGEFCLAGVRLPGGRRIGAGVLKDEEEFVLWNSISHKTLNPAFPNALPMEKKWGRGHKI